MKKNLEHKSYHISIVIAVVYGRFCGHLRSFLWSFAVVFVVVCGRFWLFSAILSRFAGHFRLFEVVTWA